MVIALLILLDTLNCTNFDENCATCDSTGCLTCKGNYKLDKDGNCALNSTWYT